MMRVVELFGYSPDDQSAMASTARTKLQCPFIEGPCIKRYANGHVCGVCTIDLERGDPLICCPLRLHGRDFQILRDIGCIAFGPGLPFVLPGDGRICEEEHIAVVIQRGETGGNSHNYSQRKKSFGFDCLLARIGSDGQLCEFVGVEFGAIHVRGDYQSEEIAHPKAEAVYLNRTARPNWEVVYNSILPRLIQKGYLLRREPLCFKGQFFVCQTLVYGKIFARMGGEPPTYPLQQGTVSILSYSLGSAEYEGHVRNLVPLRRATTTIEQMVLACSAPRRPPPPGFYEKAIRAQLY